MRDAELALGPGEFVGTGIARRHELRIGNATGEVLRMPASHPAEPDDACAQPHCSTILFSRHDVVAASASASALTPSTIDVRGVARPATTSKKCAISAA